MWKLSGVLIMTQFKKADLSVEFLYTWCWHRDKPSCSLKGKWRPRLAAHQGPREPRAAAVLGSVREVQGSCGFFREWSQIHRKLEASVSQVGAQEIGARARIHIQGSQALGITPLRIHWIQLAQTQLRVLVGQEPSWSEVQSSRTALIPCTIHRWKNWPWTNGLIT